MTIPQQIHGPVRCGTCGATVNAPVNEKAASQERAQEPMTGDEFANHVAPLKVTQRYTLAPAAPPADQDAFAAIWTLRAQVERLEREREGWAQSADAHATDLQRAEATIAALQADAERMRADLDIAKGAALRFQANGVYVMGQLCDACLLKLDAARAARATKDSSGEGT